MSEHIVGSYDADLTLLRQRISEMGGVAEKMVGDSIRCLMKGDASLAQAVVAADTRVDILQREIEEHAILVIARRQPLAVDLRETIAAIRLASDLERVGDLAKNVGKRAVAIAGAFQPRVVAGIGHMGELAMVQLKDVLDAYANRDGEAALVVWRRDEQIDQLYTSVFRELLTYMLEDPRSITACTHLLFCAKNIERVGDHSTNIAETVHYLVTGDSLTLDRPKSDRSSEPLEQQRA